MSAFLRSLVELFGIVYLRFRPMPRLWCVWLVGVNAACLLFLDRVEGQVVLALTAIAVILQVAIYQRLGFTRILGIVHVMWLPMFAWMATRLDGIRADPDLAVWLAVLAVTNAVSLIVDATDGIRFVRGERAPHYHWNKAAS